MVPFLYPSSTCFKITSEFKVAGIGFISVLKEKDLKRVFETP